VKVNLERMGWHCGCGPKSWDAGIGKGRRFEVAGVWVPGVESVLEQKVWRERDRRCGERWFGLWKEVGQEKRLVEFGVRPEGGRGGACG